jgi:hypothetical protein
VTARASVTVKQRYLKERQAGRVISPSQDPPPHHRVYCSNDMPTCMYCSNDMGSGMFKLCYEHRRCQEPGCVKHARGTTLFCIAHGGGERCQSEGCRKAAACHGVGLARTFCLTHGGGRRCGHVTFDGERVPCTSSAIGRTGYCKRHGGGRRCAHTQCASSARSGSRYCRKHSRECVMETCTRPVHHQYEVYCYTHGNAFTAMFDQMNQTSIRFAESHSTNHSTDPTWLSDSVLV